MGRKSYKTAKRQWKRYGIEEHSLETFKSKIGVSRYPSRLAARASAFEFIEHFYNRVRRHSSLGYLSPSEYEQSILEEAAVA